MNIMNNKKIVLALYKSKLELCRDFGYKLGHHKYVKPGFNLGRSLLKCKKIKNKEKRSNYIMNHIRQGYRDNKNINDEYIVDMYIDEGFQVLRNLNNLLNLKKNKKKINIEKYYDTDFIFFDYFED